jgi:hypothetical protein
VPKTVNLLSKFEINNYFIKDYKIEGLSKKLEALNCGVRSHCLTADFLGQSHSHSEPENYQTGQY